MCTFSTSQYIQRHGLGKMVAAAFHICQMTKSVTDSRTHATRMYTTGVSACNALAGGEYVMLTLVPLASRKPALTLLALLVLTSVSCHAARRLFRPSQQRQLCQVCYEAMLAPPSTAGSPVHLTHGHLLAYAAPQANTTAEQTDQQACVRRLGISSRCAHQQLKWCWWRKATCHGHR